MYTCINGHLEVAKWLFSKMTVRDMANFEKTNKHTMFRLVCKQGHIEITKWLIEIIPEIDVSDNKLCGDAFSYACENGHIKLAQLYYNTLFFILESICTLYGARKNSLFPNRNTGIRSTHAAPSPGGQDSSHGEQNLTY